MATPSTPTGPTRAILLGANPHPRTVATIRSLGRAGIPVIGIDHVAPPHRGDSRYLTRRVAVESLDATLDCLDELAAEGGVVIPTRDDYLLFLARNHAKLAGSFALSVPAWKDLRKVVDITACYEIARRVGVGTPDFHKPRDAAALRQIVDGFDLDNEDYILRTSPGTVPANPASGRYTRVAGREAARIIESCEEIRGRLGEYPTIVKVVPGEAQQCVGVSLVVDRTQEVVATCCVQRLRLYTYSRDYTHHGGVMTHPYALGANVYCESAHDAEAVAAATALVRAAGFYGVVTVEFRRNPVDGSLMLIKCDPRVVRATSLSTRVGVDLPLLLHQTMAGATPTPVTAYQSGIAWLWFSQFLLALWENRDDMRVRAELYALLKNVRRIKAFAFFDLRDPAPFVMHWLWQLRTFAGKRLRNLGIRLTRRRARAEAVAASP